MNNSVVILGGGLTGLGCAKHLPGSVIYEAKDHPGGHVFSHEQGGVHFDEGAHICHAKDEDWLKQLYANAGDVVKMNQSRVSNWWHGQWVTYPVQNHLRDLPEDLRIRALSEIVSAQMMVADAKPKNYDEWCRAQYGNFLTDNFYREYTEKYWRTKMEEMDIDWLAGRLLPSQIERIVHGAIAPLDEKQSVFSTFHYPARGGFFAFFEKFYEGIDVQFDARCIEVDVTKREVLFADGQRVSYQRLINTTPLNEFVRNIRGVDVPDRVSEAAEELRHTQLIGINFIVNRKLDLPYHWFYIYDSDIDVSRVKVMSNLIPETTPPGKTVLQTEIFRRDDEAFDVEALKAKAVVDMARILQFDPGDVEMIDHVTASHAYPIPMLGRIKAVEDITTWLAEHRIQSIGLCGKWKYVWSNQAFAAGREAAERILS